MIVETSVTPVLQPAIMEDETFDNATNPFSDEVNQEDLQEISLSASHHSGNEEESVTPAEHIDKSDDTDVHVETIQQPTDVKEEVEEEEESSSHQNDEHDKLRLISEVLDLQHTLDDLSQRVDNVKEENAKLKSENQVLGQYIDNLMAASNVFRKSGSTKPVKSPTSKRP